MNPKKASKFWLLLLALLVASFGLLWLLNSADGHVLLG